MKSLSKDPTILTHPNIPKPLHGISPRNIMGQKWWDIKRKEAYKSTNYRCSACNVPREKAKYYRRLEGHEYYNYNYTTGTLILKKIVPLCHSCHNFIHSGRLYAMYEKGEITFERIKNILEHGFRILSENALDAFWGTIQIADTLGIETDVEPQFPEPCDVRWHEWKMVIESKKYYSKFKNEEEWENFYNEKKI